jgi:hypothetical protein
VEAAHLLEARMAADIRKRNARRADPAYALLEEEEEEEDDRERKKKRSSKRKRKNKKRSRSDSSSSESSSSSSDSDGSDSESSSDDERRKRRRRKDKKRKEDKKKVRRIASPHPAASSLSLGVPGSKDPPCGKRLLACASRQQGVPGITTKARHRQKHTED